MANSSLSHTSLVTLLARVSGSAGSRPAASRACFALAMSSPVLVLLRLRIGVIANPPLRHRTREARIERQSRSDQDIPCGSPTCSDGFVRVRSDGQQATGVCLRGHGATSRDRRWAELAPSASAQAPPPLPKAFVLVDADTGAVIAQQDARTVRPPASTIKLMTALIADRSG